MKNKFGLVLVLSQFVAALAFAAPAASPLISKSSGGGFMMPEYAGGVRCDVYADKVVITNQYGMQGPTAFKVQEVRSIRLTGDMQTVIATAAKEEVTSKPNNLCDGPSTSIIANPDQNAGVLIFSTGGCGSPKQERNGMASSKLRNLVDQFCPLTYDFSDPTN